MKVLEWMKRRGPAVALAVCLAACAFGGPGTLAVYAEDGEAVEETGPDAENRDTRDGPDGDGADADGGVGDGEEGGGEPDGGCDAGPGETPEHAGAENGAVAAMGALPAALPPTGVGVTIADFDALDTTVIGAGWSYDDSGKTLTISLDGEYVIKGNGNQTDNVIVVNPVVTATITLDNVNISTTSTHAFDLKDAEVELWLVGDNTLITEKDIAAGLHVPDGAKVTIGAGSERDTLTAKNTYGPAGRGAGIGGGGEFSGNGEDGGEILIQGGAITAQSREGAGIGGGGSDNGGAGGAITITGGLVTAASEYGAGIGGGYGRLAGNGVGGGGGAITITGGTVTATSERGAAIGGGSAPGPVLGGNMSTGGAGGDVKISGDAVVVAQGNPNGNDIGPSPNTNGNMPGSDGTIIIDGGSVDTVNGNMSPPPRRTDGTQMARVTIVTGAAATLRDDYGEADTRDTGSGHTLYRWLPGGVNVGLTLTAAGQSWSGTVDAGNGMHLFFPFPALTPEHTQVENGYDQDLRVGYARVTVNGMAPSPALPELARDGLPLVSGTDYSVNGNTSTATLYGESLNAWEEAHYTLSFAFGDGFTSSFVLTVGDPDTPPPTPIPTPGSGTRRSGGGGGTSLGDAHTTSTLPVTADLQTWSGGAEGLTFVVEGVSPAALMAVSVDGVVLEPGSYTVREGSVILTLSPAYLEALPAGEYALSMQFWSGTAAARFTVRPTGSGGGDGGSGGAATETAVADTHNPNMGGGAEQPGGRLGGVVPTLALLACLGGAAVALRRLAAVGWE